ncbi:LytR/AlgR family response regulator transcription factor [Vagococcus hydrophili]|uniref:Response regulator transcription factor n=1 Tax=Vagococcus hydrophili TaxID=2714947 RepID=A0A6G8AS60_9ENTE|nr:LytTR family DNA-binding domain-containing protein [Vagococcus hydrophili]QIL47836.1 response regulator transcription factor [Vagococcus hydrophili]
MLPIFICENDPVQKKRFEDIIKKFIMIEDYDMKIELSTNNPYEILSYLDNHENIRGAYFLDIDLGKEINGIQLGSKIRKKDVFGRIIFVTTHSELMSLTFTYKVEAMDYIVKDNPEKIQRKIQDCLKRINDHYTSETIQEKDRIKLKINNQIRVFPLEEVLFFETTELSHKIKLHLINNRIEFYGNLGELETLSNKFVRIHKSYLINEDNIMTVDPKKREVIMVNGESCLVSVRKMKLLK